MAANALSFSSLLQGLLPMLNNLAESRQEPVILGLVLLVAMFIISGLSALVFRVSSTSASSANAFQGRRARKRRLDDFGFPPGWPEEIDADAFEAKSVHQFGGHLRNWKALAAQILKHFTSSASKLFENSIDQ